METYIIFATSQGGYMQVWRADYETYEKAKNDGYLEHPAHSTFAGRREELTFITFVRAEDDHDFILGRSRQEEQLWSA